MIEHILQVLHQPENWLLVSLVILCGYAGGKLSSRLGVPSIVGYLVVGVIMGRSVTDMIDGETAEVLGLVTDFGLGIVACLIGAELAPSVLRRMGRGLTAILLCQFFGAVVLVFVLVWAFGRGAVSFTSSVLPAALLFAAVSAATAPAGTVAVVQEYKAKGPMTSMLLAVVGLDDGLAIMIYAFGGAGAKALVTHKGLAIAPILGNALREIVGSAALGVGIGLALAAMIKRTRSTGAVLTLTIGAVLLATGLSNAVHLSTILSNLVLGMTVANISARDAERMSDTMETIVHTVYVLFFVVAGAHLDFRVLLTTGLIAPVYIIGRTAGKMAGAYAGAVLSGADSIMRKYLGLGLLSQAGVAVGLALMASQELRHTGPEGKEVGALLINTIAATTIFFEVFGPVATKIALTKAGEVNVRTGPGEEPGETG